MSLTTELSALLNVHAAENKSNTPDYILAGFMIACLDAFNDSVQDRDRWHGFVYDPAADHE